MVRGTLGDVKSHYFSNLGEVALRGMGFWFPAHLVPFTLKPSTPSLLKDPFSSPQKSIKHLDQKLLIVLETGIHTIQIRNLPSSSL